MKSPEINGANETPGNKANKLGKNIPQGQLIDEDMHKLAMNNNTYNTNSSLSNLNFNCIPGSLLQTRFSKLAEKTANSGANYYNLSPNVEFIKGQFIGNGKFGSVFSGLSVNTGEIVAIKSIKLKSSTSYQKQIFAINKAVERLSQLRHKNIVRYICTQPSENNDEVDIIFEYCNGGSIKQLLERYDNFDEKLIKLYAKQIVEGLVYLHEQGIVHRNINSCNILVDGNGVVKLSDFVVSNILVGDNPEKILYFNTNNGQGK